MADTPKSPQTPGRPAAPNQSTGQASGAARVEPKGQSSQETAHARRIRTRKMRDAERQRNVLYATGGAIGLALLVLIIGGIYDQLWMPSRPVAQVNTATLTRGDYWREQRFALARQISQNLQLLALFGANQQISAQFAGKSPEIDQQVRTIRTAEVAQDTVTTWEDAQLTLQGTAALNVQASLDEINQQIVQDLGSLFLPVESPPISTTTDVTATTQAVLTAQLQATATAATLATTLAAPTATPGGPTATPPPSATPEPTGTTPPTPIGSVAAEQVGKIATEIFNRYKLELDQVSLKAALTADDFRASLESEYRVQVLKRKLQAQLVAETSFAPSTEPDKVRASQILLSVVVPAEATAAQRDQAFAARKAEADTLVNRLRGGEDFATLATISSDDPGSKLKGGDIGLFGKDGQSDSGGTYAPEVVAVAFTLAEKSISDPIQSQFGWHILTVTQRDVPATDQQLRDARTKAIDAWLAEQRTKAQIQRFPALTPTPVEPTTIATPTTVPIFIPGPPTPVPTATVTPITGATLVPVLPTPIPTSVPTSVATAVPSSPIPTP